MQLSRRQLLVLAAAARLRAAAPPESIQLGFSLYGMKDFRLGDAIELCGRLGYSTIELTLNEGFPAEPKLLSVGDRRQLRYQFTDLDLTLAGMMEHILLTANDLEHQQNLEKIKQAAELGHAVGPNVTAANPPILETVLGGRPEQWEELKDPMAERLSDWKRVAEEHNITIAIKPHVRSAAHRPEHGLWLLDQVRSRRIRMVYDNGHYQIQGLSMAETLPKLLESTVFVHVKDVSGTPEKPQFLLPGQGDTDYVDLFRRLIAGHFRGPVVVEVSSQLHSKPDYHAFLAAETSFEALDEALAQARAEVG